MRLVLELPESWKVIPANGFVGVVVDHGVVLEIPQLSPVPEDVWAWSRECANRDVPPGASEVVVTNKFDHKTKLGWPIAIYESEGRAGADLIESRLHAVFAMLEYGSIVVARAKQADRMAANRARILEVLESARPDWGYDPRASIRDLLAI